MRGFALKFCTEEGNWYMVGNNTPMFSVRDPLKFPDFIHTQKRPGCEASPRTQARIEFALAVTAAMTPAERIRSRIPSNSCDSLGVAKHSAQNTPPQGGGDTQFDHKRRRHCCGYASFDLLMSSLTIWSMACMTRCDTASSSSPILIQDLEIGGSRVLIGGTKSRPIRLSDGYQKIDCKMDGMAIGLKSRLVTKS